MKIKSVSSFVAAILVAGLTASASSHAKPAEKKADAKAAAPAADKAAAPKAAELDINTATEAELVALPAIGDAYAKKIIAGRPYDRKDQLVSKNVLPGAVYAKVKDAIVAKQAPGAAGGNVTAAPKGAAPAQPVLPTK